MDDVILADVLISPAIDASIQFRNATWTPGVAVNRIGDAVLPAAPELLEQLHAAYRAETPVAP